MHLEKRIIIWTNIIFSVTGLTTIGSFYLTLGANDQIFVAYLVCSEGTSYKFSNVSQVEEDQIAKTRKYIVSGQFSLGKHTGSYFAEVKIGYFNANSTIIWRYTGPLTNWTKRMHSFDHFL